jgi:hypothetical protein
MLYSPPCFLIACAIKSATAFVLKGSNEGHKLFKDCFLLSAFRTAIMNLLIKVVSSEQTHREHVKPEEYITKSACLVSFRQPNKTSLFPTIGKISLLCFFALRVEIA